MRASSAAVYYPISGAAGQGGIVRLVPHRRRDGLEDLVDPG